ncbi:POTASSIUM CHANNEL SUBFAMILY K [Salix purpurea]|uniref:POTASSIUM CHANNEL SUBFAMILY K n=1 Tax=Salix purpurea TaxID=77065 RepID=A0A9Q0VY83_SALPP|nr:POTASSIUM CHANNEL SUBFAMILY K [Salix purpurea]
MAINDDAMQSLLSDEENAFQRRRFRQPTNDDLTEIKHPDQQNGNSSLKWLESFLENQNFSFKKALCVFTLIMNQIEGKKTNGILDAVYFSVVTMTTVGYGDLVPRTALAKLLSCVYVFTGMALGGIIISKAADYIVEKQEILLVRAMHVNEKIGSSEILKEAETHKLKVSNLSMHFTVFVLPSPLLDTEMIASRPGPVGYFAVFWILSSTICLAQFFLYSAELYTEKRQRLLVERVLARNVTASDLEEADIDHDKTVSAAEFIVYTLKEMGKISQEDISLVMERFSKLDVDQSGTLTESDIISS